ncbi:FecR family protein [Arcticibacter tournemirensis]|uniref:DUF4974 domain-containing protein n=1 Tax=Arcticibacter tournemirensis TaxID=699437 RepID=A0A5M9HFV9_9SPHI|nr:FecR domain-containing protein [Arcticibacter tournemirensis]KAA8485369.1 DUF4974 domain-containing protein [Arcticibacter tournemirensis]TQM50342.1 FecR family protein [Arcticibacter tournemirensis]
MEYDRKKDLHRRYLSRELTAEELREFFSILEQSHADDLPGFDDVASDFPTALEPSENLAAKIINKHDNTRSLWLITKRSAAAAIAVLMLFGAWKGYLEYSYIQKTKTFATIKVPQGKITKLKLEDGTVITLTSGTTFKYPQAFTRTERRVYLLDGQAFFEVANDKSKPFRVNSGKLSTTVLGTSFIIKHYKDYGYEKVSLYTGKVRVDRNGINGRPVILHPGQEFDYHNGTLSTVKGFDNSRDPEESGTLDFNRTDFKDAVYSMASYYGVKILFNEDEFKEFRISGNFSSGSVEEMLQSLTFIYPFKVKKTGSSTYKLIRIDKN